MDEGRDRYSQQFPAPQSRYADVGAESLSAIAREAPLRSAQGAAGEMRHRRHDEDDGKGGSSKVRLLLIGDDVRRFADVLRERLERRAEFSSDRTAPL